MMVDDEDDLFGDIKHLEHLNSLSLTEKEEKGHFGVGVLNDVFRYSGYNVLTMKTLGDYSQEFNTLSDNLLFAVSKIGRPSLIKPIKLDLEIRSINGYHQYLKHCDDHFPKLSHMERTVVLLRPIIVKTGLGKTFENILKVNNFYIIKKSRGMLKPAEVSILCKMEGIHDKENANTFKKMMLEGPVEIYLLSKYGGVGEAKSLIDGCMGGRKGVS